MKHAVLLLSIIIGLAASALAGEKSLKDVLPAEAVVILWAENPATLVDAINNFTPGPEADMPPLTGLLPDLMLLGQGWENLPAAAVVMFDREEPLEGDGTIAFLFSVEGEAVEDLNTQAKHVIFGDFKGYAAAIIKGEGSFDDLVSEGTYIPAPEAFKMIEESPLFLHLNVKRLASLINDKLQEADANEIIAADFTLGDAPEDSLEGIFGRETALQVLADFRKLAGEVLGEFESFDAAVTIDSEGLQLESLFTVAENGHLSRYFLAPEEFIRPPLPALENFQIGFWGRANKQVIQRQMSDVRAIYNYLVRKIIAGSGTDKNLHRSQLKSMYDKMEMAALGSADESFFAAGSKEGMLTYVLGYQFDYAPIVYPFLQPAIAEAIAANSNSLNQYERECCTIYGQSVSKLTLNPTPDDPAAGVIAAMSRPEGFTCYYTLHQKEYILADSEETLTAVLDLLLDKEDGQALTETDTAKGLLSKIGDGNCFTFLVVPARMMEYIAAIQAKMQGLAYTPRPLPFATPLGFGIKIENGHQVRLCAYVPQASASECMATIIGLMAAGIEFPD